MSDSVAGSADTTPALGKTVAYIMSRFPKISETFILNEMLQLECLGLRVEVFPILREHESVVHPDAEAFAARMHDTKIRSMELWRAQLYWLRRRPKAYGRAWVRAIHGNRRSPKFLSRALIVVPKAAWFARLMEELKVEHVHAHFATHPALAAVVVRELTGIPYSFTAHAHDIYVDCTMLPEKTRSASFVVAISQHGRDLLASHCPEAANRITVIHCGVDLGVFTPDAAADSPEPFTLVSVGRLVEMKGHAYLLRACAELKARGIPFRCLIVGEGPDLDSLDNLRQELGLSQEVRFLGAQTHDQIKQTVAAASVFVLASVTTERGAKEGIPVALMEAFALERPVVTTAVGGVPELVDNEVSGLLVPERDPSAIADALERIFQDPELGHRLGQAGRAKVEREFDLQRNIAALYDLLCRDWRQQSGAVPEPLAEPLAVAGTVGD